MASHQTVQNVRAKIYFVWPHDRPGLGVHVDLAEIIDALQRVENAAAADDSCLKVQLPSGTVGETQFEAVLPKVPDVCDSGKQQVTSIPAARCELLAGHSATDSSWTTVLAGETADFRDLSPSCHQFDGIGSPLARLHEVLRRPGCEAGIVYLDAAHLMILHQPPPLGMDCGRIRKKREKSLNGTKFTDNG